MQHQPIQPIEHQLDKRDAEIIMAYAKQFHVKEVYLFGSSLDPEQEAHDIDLAVRGIASDVFFDFYGKLLRYLSKPVDLIDLSKNTRLSQLIETQAVKIYG